LWADALSAQDKAKRIDDYKQIETIWYTQLYAAAPLLSYASYYAMSPRMHGYHHPVASLSGGMLDYVWVSSQ
jgi:ABC-type oligopeptide transport system substrate-binding subunit